MNSRLTAAKQLTLGGMITAITVLCLYASSLFPVGRVPLLFMASVMVTILSGEGAYVSALLCYAASAAIVFFLLPDRQPAYFYILLLGHYGIFRAFVQTRIQSRLFRLMVKVFYCDIFLSLGVYLVMLLIDGFAFSFPYGLPVWAVVLLTQPALVGYDLLYGASIALYQTYMRRAFISRT